MQRTRTGLKKNLPFEKKEIRDLLPEALKASCEGEQDPAFAWSPSVRRILYLGIQKKITVQIYRTVTEK